MECVGLRLATHMDKMNRLLQDCVVLFSHTKRHTHLHIIFFYRQWYTEDFKVLLTYFVLLSVGKMTVKIFKSVATAILLTILNFKTLKGKRIPRTWDVNAASKCQHFIPEKTEQMKLILTSLSQFSSPHCSKILISDYLSVQNFLQI